MIDLHMHSIYSDGSDSIITLLKKAEEKKLNVISITDHESCKGYLELRNININKYYNGKIITGIEIKCSYGKNLIEVLGYNINIDKMNKWTDEYYIDKSKEKIQDKYFNILYDKCIDMGLMLKDKEKINWNPKEMWASATIYNLIKENEFNKEKLPEDLWEDFDVFSKKYCGDTDSQFYIDKTKDYPTLNEAINAIKLADGLVFLPHLFIYKWALNKEKLIDDILENYQIDGIECMHSTFTEEQEKYLLDLCLKRNYYKSGGSDYHGTYKKGIEMGVGKGNLNVPNDFINSWIKY